MTIIYRPESLGVPYTNVYYKDLDNNLHIIRADTLNTEEACNSVINVLDEMEVSKGNWKKPVLALIEGGLFKEDNA